MELSNSLDLAIQERVAEVAYELAESRGFVSGQEQEDWLAAQRIVQNEIRDKLAALRANGTSGGAPLDIALQDQITQAAYQLSEQRNFEPGHALDDWLQAEAMIAGEVRQRLGGTPAAQAQPEISASELQPEAEMPVGNPAYQ